MLTTEPEQGTVQDVIKSVIDTVRAERPYIVGGKSDLPVKLNQNENPLDLPAEIKDRLVEEFRSIPFNRYPREHPDRLAEALAARHGVAPESILVGNGSNELTYLTGLCLLRPGTPVVMPRPMFSLYEKVARLYGASLETVAPRPDFSFDTDGLVAAIQRVRPNLTVVTTPNNPTGLAMSFEEVEAVVKAAPGVVLVDEAYVEFNSERPATDLLETSPNLIILRTFSKAFGLAGLRVGYLIAHPELLAEFRKARLPFVVDALAEATALVLLEHEKLLSTRVEELKQSVRELVEEMTQMPDVRVVPTQANFVIFGTTLEPSELMARLAEAGVLVRDVSGYAELRGFVRVNAGTASENRQFLQALKSALSA